ncbi:MAG: cyclase family protein [Anaerolineae bacterium]|nr:cyclase family protein [Anaerolineae bacterium]
MSNSYRLIDVSHTVQHGVATYKGLPAPIICDYLSRDASRVYYAPGTEFHIGQIEMVSSTGTYLDAPFHRFAHGKDISELPLESLANLEGVVLRRGRIRGRAIGPSAFRDIDVEGKAVLVQTGWSAYYATEKYFGEHPYLTSDAAEYLRDAGAVLVGIDSLNIDDTADGTRPVHTILLDSGIPIVEHLTNLSALPEQDFRFFAVPIKVKALGTFPVRAFGLVKT